MSLPSLAALPATLKPLAERAEQNFRTAIAALSAEQIASFDSWSDERHADFARVTAGSDFVAEQVQRDPAFLLALAATGELERALQPGEMGAQLEALLADCADEDELGRRLRRFRRRQQMRIIWRDLTRRSDLAGTCRDLSDLADASIDQSLAWLYQRHCQQFGVPIGNRSGLPQKMIVLGMGKLGAGELNLSSDIDLIFGYPEGGETQGAKRALDNQEFFTRLGQKLIKSLDAITVEGFAFRVDMRLRPYGSSGPLVHSFAALEQYYQDQGRDWERYAMIKARVVGGDQEAGQRLLELLRPFVYRRYLDFSAIEALRTMKQLIQQEVRRKGMSENIKLGAGGIREVEFIAQAFQLIHGGRDLSLQQRPLLRVLAILEGQGYLPPQVVAELREGYEFLRYAEHALQAIADRQTQMLPEDEFERIRVAFIMGFANWSAFHQATNQWRERIDWHFRQVIADPDEDEEGRVDTTIGGEWIPLWEEAVDEESACRQFADAGFAQPAAAWKRLTDLRNGPQVRAMQRLGRERLDAFMPRLLNMIAERGPADALLERVLPLIEAVARRSAYLVLLTENPGALERLLTLCAASPMVAEQIARFPILLDELLNEGRLFRPPQAAELGAELRERLMRIPEDDLEQQMETLRHFKLAHALRVVASEIAGTLPLMKVSDYLTWLAEAILEQVLSLTWDQLVQRHGRPTRVDGTPCAPDFIIIGYGKSGGLELGHGSDLDLVFIHDGDPQSETDGAKPIDGAQFYTRLGQKIIHFLTAQTPSGMLYEVDMRLRPSGASGLLVSSLRAFEAYQLGEAWTWEHQALVRARVLAGCQRVAVAFEAIRAKVLGQQRDLAELRKEVSEMRAKMRDNLGTPSTAAGTAANAFEAAAPFDLKQDAGGIVDIEFMVQYAALAWSWQHPELVEFTDNIRILEALERVGLMSGEDVLKLQDAYKAYRAAAHRLSLQKQPGVVSGDHFHAERRMVMQMWKAFELT
ncbi:bifunctional [glutamate--ammonia ligase]-adenylyl-L-tyrosine phosphorylase/[glutamate--ammonia-ligase] adenylyltransferase [Pseudomonas sp. BGr12]|uniref:bifunctional [glutamate--ammonia ligase]-adenylyl-L-tyrosine phosphorylase/[glutamate--ammonia-ligase] adenylyltransferase n=1 Tax=unclassified Pseudomonas TaxID=196821 RepID=UPI00177C9B79|nr:MULTISPECIES: bifunctional [glutamate--ammonia ligase]-adenylyl-L-tyrosine phosphorylase/[glutamate--ammonia-ligase] adenylyltransferase [unclassified Pseudomonas]MBD9501531.1 bifunctional [glutamate--ammonia ligase]-adenylyl-L-tyrosine phosphorylase/[glutamate--ammonia-ligase] adenylyltransferase [Pseudomonas sp. PDM17]MBD9576489.1 bifunctional [glutamate--ammonia ligase]-adenylyl-L-tyrosine phosphorylase/[glutamate--ammonia-ligase] adenylyltransferase [Pseudomonas sp. PDM23]MBD9670416.1 bif